MRLVVISDLNSSYGSLTYPQTVPAAIKRILELKPDLVLITGDMVAGQRPSKLLNELELTAMWEVFERVVAKPLRQAGIPLLAVAGNHDASAEPKFKRERKAFNDYWQSRQPKLQAVAKNTPLQWAWKLNNLTVVGVDATQHGPLRPTAQRDWLVQALRGLKPATSEVIVVAGHLPIWAFAKGRESGILKDPELELLLLENGVDAYISGHHHAFYPAIHNELLQFSMGALGSGRRALIGSRKKAPASFLLMDIAVNGEFSYHALWGKGFRQQIKVEQLPKTIRSNEVMLLRAGG